MPIGTWTATFAVGLLGAVVCVLLGTPLPWMIGPLVFTAAGRMFGWGLRTPRGTRGAGQWAIGTALGLYFTPAVLNELLPIVPAVFVGAAFALALGAVSGRLLARLAGTDPTTAFFASMPGGASQMATLAERFNARVDLVTAAHSLRIMMVVILVPAAFVGLNLHGIDDYQVSVQEVRIPGLLLLAALTALGAVVWKRLRQPNPWVVGPLVVAAAITATGHAPSALPHALVAGGQLCIGCSLGSLFTQEFFRGAPRFLSASALVTLVMLAAAGLFGTALAAFSGLSAPAVVLGLAPGGIAEMCITAKVLQLGVPVVTAFHVVRMLAVVILSGPLYVRLARREGPGTV